MEDQTTRRFSRRKAAQDTIVLSSKNLNEEYNTPEPNQTRTNNIDDKISNKEIGGDAEDNQMRNDISHIKRKFDGVGSDLEELQHEQSVKKLKGNPDNSHAVHDGSENMIETKQYQEISITVRDVNPALEKLLTENVHNGDGNVINSSDACSNVMSKQHSEIAKDIMSVQETSSSATDINAGSTAESTVVYDSYIIPENIVYVPQSRMVTGSSTNMQQGSYESQTESGYINSNAVCYDQDGATISLLASYDQPTNNDSVAHNPAQFTGGGYIAEVEQAGHTEKTIVQVQNTSTLENVPSEDIEPTQRNTLEKGVCLPIVKTSLGYRRQVTSRDIAQEGKTEKGLQRPMEQILIMPEFSQLMDRLEPDDNIDQHVITIDSGDPSAPKDCRKKLAMQCAYCDTILKSKHEFRRHIIKHPDVNFKPWKCPLCDYRALIKPTIKKHINVHSEVKPYVCTECGRGFNFKQKLQLHMKYHQDIREFFCPKCAMSFHEIKTLKNHLIHIHRVQKVTEFLKTQDYRTPRDVHLAARNGNIKYNASLDTSEKVITTEKLYPKTSKLLKFAKQQTNVGQHFEGIENLITHSNSDTTVIYKEEVIHHQLEIASSQEVDSSPKDILALNEKNTVEMGNLVETVNTKAVEANECSKKDEQTEINSNSTSVSNVVANYKNILTDITKTKLPEKTDHSSKKRYEVIVIDNKMKNVSIPVQQLLEGKVDTLNKGQKKPRIIYIKLPPNVKIVRKSDEPNQDIKMEKLQTQSSKPEENYNNKPTSTSFGKTSNIKGNEKTGSETISDIENSTDMNEDSSIEQKESDSNGKENAVADMENEDVNDIDYCNEDESDNDGNENSEITQIKEKTNVAKLNNGEKKLTEVKEKSNEKENQLSSDSDSVKQNTVDENDDPASPDSKRSKMHDPPKLSAKIKDNKHETISDQSKNQDQLSEIQKPLIFSNARSKSRNDIEESVKEYIIFGTASDTNCTLYTCRVCEKESSAELSFKTYSRFMDHLFTQHPQVKPFKCDECESFYRTRPNLLSHKKSHNDNNKKYACLQCGKHFRFSQKLKVHLRVHDNLRSFKCNLCGRAFNENSDLNRHFKKVHLREKHVICPICNKSFYATADVKRHMQSHNEQKIFHCKYCDKMYQTSLSLSQHMKSHTCMFHCEICNRDFGSYSGFMAHKVMHDESSDGYNCDICQKLLTTKGSLKRHLQSCHTNYRPYKCEICDKSFKSKKDLQSHNMAHDNVEYVCDTCNFQTKRYDCLKVHQRLHAPVKPFQCGVCWKEYTQKSSLDQHMQQHTGESYRCEICQAKMSSKNTLLQHMMKQHVPEHLKDEVKKSGSMTVYMCEHCRSMFVSQDALAVHIMTDHLKQGLGTSYSDGTLDTTKATTFTIGVESAESTADVEYEVVTENAQYTENTPIEIIPFPPNTTYSSENDNYPKQQMVSLLQPMEDHSNSLTEEQLPLVQNVTNITETSAEESQKNFISIDYGGKSETIEVAFVDNGEGYEEVVTADGSQYFVSEDGGELQDTMIADS